MPDANTVGGVNVEVRADLAQYNAALKTAESNTQASAARMAGAFGQTTNATNTLARAQLALIEMFQRTGAVSAEAVRAVGGYAAAQVILADTSKAAAAAQADLGKAEAATAAVTRAATVATGGETAAVIANTAAIRANGAAHVSSRAAYEATVLVHEVLSGRFSRLGGSAMILGQQMLGASGTAGLLSAVMSPLGLTILGVAGAAIAAGVATLQYEGDMRQLQATTLGLGAASGQTAQALSDAADAASAASGESGQASLKEAEAFAQAGVQSQATITALSADVKTFAALTGEDASKAQDELAAAMANPTKGAQELNDKLGILDATTLQHIEHLQAMGLKDQADAELTHALGVRMDEAHRAGVGLNNEVDGLVAGFQNLWTWLGKTNEQLEIFSRYGFAAPGLIQQGEQSAAAAQQQAQAHAMLNTMSGGGVAPFLGTPEGGDQTRRQALLDSISKLRLATFADIVQRGAGSQQVRQDAIALAEYNRAYATLIPQEQKAHELADLDTRLAVARRAHNRPEISDLTRQRSLVETGGEVMLPEEANQRAADAAAQANASTGGGGGGHHGAHVDQIARETDRLTVNTTALLAEAEAYLKDNDAAVLLQAARKKAADFEVTHPKADLAANTQAFLNEGIATDAAQFAKRASDIEAQAQALQHLNEETMGGAHATADYSERIREATDLAHLQILADLATGQAKTDLLAIIKQLTKAYDDQNAAKARERALTDMDNQLNKVLDHAFDNDKFVEKHTDDVNASIAALQAQAATYGMTAQQAATYLEYQKLLDDATKQHIDLTDADRAKLLALAEAYGQAETSAKKLTEAQQAAAEASQSVADGLEKVLETAIFDRKRGSATAALKAFGLDLAKEFLQAETLGKGPLAGILGTSQTGGPGGVNGGFLNRIVGGLFGLPGSVGGKPDGTPSNPLHVLLGGGGGAPGSGGISLGGFSGLGQSDANGNPLGGGGGGDAISGILQGLGSGGGGGGGLISSIASLFGLGGSGGSRPPDGTQANPFYVVSSQGGGGSGGGFGGLLSSLLGGGGGGGAGIGAAVGSLFGAGGGSAAAIGDVIGAAILHNGTDYASARQDRFVDPAVFARAPRLHSGLAPGEFPAILQQGEGVSPRGGHGGGGGPRLVQISLAGANGDQTIKRYTREGVMAGMKASQEASPAQQLRYQLLEG